MDFTIRNINNCDNSESIRKASSPRQGAPSRMPGNPPRPNRVATPLSFHFVLGPLRIQNMKLAALRVKGYENASDWLNED